MKSLKIIYFAHVFGIVWLMSIVAFIGTLLHGLLVTKVVTEQHNTVLVFVVLTGLFTFLGVSFFYLMHFLFLRKKSVQGTPGSPRIAVWLLVAILLFVGLIGINGAYNIGKATKNVEEANIEPQQTQFPTGKEVLDELNRYRVSQGLPEFILSDILCDNIAERWQNYRKTGSHAGLKEFMNREYPPGFTASEILVSGSTAKEMVEKWSQSPSHDYYIKHNSKACVYSDEGSSVALLSN